MRNTLYDQARNEGKTEGIKEGIKYGKPLRKRQVIIERINYS